jgi:opacity protein-like surface antigen
MRSALFVALLTICTTAVAAPGSGDKGQVEWSFGLTYNFEVSAPSQNGSNIDFQAQPGFEFGVDYFVVDRLAVGFDLAWFRPDYTAVIVPEDNSGDIQIRHQANVFTGQINATYNFMDSVVSPFVEAGLGWTNFDSNVASQPPTTGCWWDPWWGYMCSSFYNTYSSSNFSYGAGLGLRWNINYDMSLKLTYRWLEIDSGNASERPALESALLEIAYHF